MSSAKHRRRKGLRKFNPPRYIDASEKPKDRTPTFKKYASNCMGGVVYRKILFFMTKKQNKNQNNDVSENIEENNFFSESEDDLDAKFRLAKNDKLIKKTKQKLLKILSKIDENLLKISDSLVENIAFMSVMLDDLMQKIKANGVKEYYCNGKNQFGFKESVEIKIYNTMQKNFQSSMKLLIDMLSRNDGNNEDAIEEVKKLLARPR